MEGIISEEEHCPGNVGSIAGAANKNVLVNAPHITTPTKEMQRSTYAPDYAMAKQYIDALTGGKDEYITFQFFTDNKKIKAAIAGKDQLASHTHKKLPLDFDFAEIKQKNGAGIWIMVNAGNGLGRSAANVVRVRSFFIDLDGSPWEPAAEALKPHMRIESSPGKWHLYWLVDDCDLGQFKITQQAIARKYDGDKACCDLPRVLRVPGFYHVKFKPVMTQLVEINDFPRYSTQQVINELGLNLAAQSKVTNQKIKQPQPIAQSAGASKKYGLAALTGEIKTLEGTKEGDRNAQLNKSAFALGQLVASEIDQDQVETELLTVAISIGLSESEAKQTIKSGMGAGAKQPRTAPASAKVAPTGYRLTELGNAERFRDQHGGVVRFVSGWKKWLFYDGRRWKVGADDKIRRMAHKTVKNLYAIAAQEPDSDKAGKIATWAKQSCRSSSISAMIKEAAALLAIDPSVLDNSPWLFNCWNCTIDMRTGAVHPHSKDDWLTKITPISYDPASEAPLFKSVLHTCFAGNQELIDFVRRFAGYCMTGSTKEQCIAIWWGGGANGKSTIITPIAEVLGDYAQTTRPETLMIKKNEGIPSDLAKLKGARLVTAAEAEDGHRLAESAIKQMTGGEKIQARALYQDWFEFVPEFKILLCTNHKPIIRGDDHAIWRRIRLIPFNVTIPEQNQDKDLPEKLKAELPGILAWMVSGAAEWMVHGLGNPAEVKEATESYQSEQSVISIFLDSCCTINPDIVVEAQQLFKEFSRWCTSEGHRKITQTKLGKMITDLGFEKTRIPGVGRVAYQGIGLNDPAIN